MKSCPRCGEERPVEDFPRDASKASGRKSQCRACDNAKSRRYYEANRDVILTRTAATRKRPRRRCATCSRPATTNRHRYCDRCRQARRRHRGRERERRRVRATPTERGYGSEHQKLRRRVARLVAAGLAICWRCGNPIDPAAPWDLGHDDADRSIYRGPEHRRCNRATAGRRPVVRRTSRAW